MSDTVTLADVDLLDPDVFREGRHHEMFRVLREQDPVHWHEEPDGPGFWNVTTHADLVATNRDAASFSSAEGTNIPDLDEESAGARDLMLNMDPPRHTRYRLLVNRGFTPRVVGRLEAALAERTTRIVDTVIERGRCDFVTDVAAELPLQAIADLMGVPQDDRAKLFEWSNRLIGFDDPEFQGSREVGLAAAGEMYLYANDLAADRRANPRDDLVTTLVNGEIDGERLSEEEFDLFFLLLAVAGNETTRNATAWGMRALIENPGEYSKLVDDPDRHLDAAVEEILRWATPVLHFRRTALVDTEVGGQPVKAGDKVVMWHISANRDETVFDEPFRFDIERSPNDHIAFGGGGPHFCLGANLARLELRLIFRELVTRIADMELDGDIDMLRSNFIGGIKRMPVRFTPAARVLG